MIQIWFNFNCQYNNNTTDGHSPDCAIEALFIFSNNFLEFNKKKKFILDIWDPQPRGWDPVPRFGGNGSVSLH